MDTLDGRRTSRALGTLVTLGVLSLLAAVSYARYELAWNPLGSTDEPFGPTLASPLLRAAPCAEESAIDEQSPLDDASPGEAVEPAVSKIYSI